MCYLVSYRESEPFRACLRRTSRTTEERTARAAVYSSDQQAGLLSESSAIRGAKDPGTGRAAAAEAHLDVWSGQRETDQRAVGIAGVGTGSQHRRGASRECARAGAWAVSGEKSSPASGPPGAAGGTAAGRADDRLHGRQCVCGGCGRETTVIGYEESEQLDVEPAKYFVVVTKREKRACKSCEERGVQAAPLPPRIIEKSLVSDRVVIDTVVSKYADHCPLYRHSAILERDSGVELSRQTLDCWVMRVGEFLVPLAEALRQELLRGSYLQADETPVGVQMHDGNGSNHLAYLWQYGRPHGAVVFDFRMGRGREGPKRFLGNFDGLLQSDGYAVYDSVGGPKMVHACCWSHARRKFVEAVKLHPQDAEAVRIVRLIEALFAIDAEARAANLDHAARHLLRSKKAPPLLEKIKAAVTAARATSLPASALAKAANYTLALWPKLTRFLEYPELEL